jgi:periplasmic divalent cation tolerance protein
MTDQVIIGLTTCPDEPSARQIAEILLEERLATCVNRIPAVQSSYVWDGHLQHGTETLLLIKTTAARAIELEARLKALHPYELPEWLVLSVAGGNEAYLAWVRQGVARKEP